MYTYFTKQSDSGVRLEQYWTTDSDCRPHQATSDFLPHSSEDCDDYEEWLWPTHCDKCNELAPAETIKRVRVVDRYQTPSGYLEPGCVYWNSEFDDQYFWENHRGPHLTVIAPNGFKWVIDSQARNCKNPDNRYHRCWKWEGDPEAGTLTVFYDDTTCRKTNDNIVVLGNWTGRLYEGKFIEEPVRSLPALTANKRGNLI